MYKTKKIFMPNFDTFKLFLHISSEQHPFFLDSSSNHENLGRYSFIGSNPFLIFKAKADSLTLTNETGLLWQKTGDPFKELQLLLEKYSFSGAEDLPFCGGAVGYLGYENCMFLEKIILKAVDDICIPDIFFAFYDQIYMFDHQTNFVTLIALDIKADPDIALLNMYDSLLNSQKSTISNKSSNSATDKNINFKSNMSKEYYLKSLEKIKNYIRSGDIYQVNFTQRFACPYTKSSIELYQNLRTINPAPFSAYIDTGEGVILSSSPERFLRINNDFIDTRPIKGTRKRGMTLSEDQILKNDLLTSEKDRAELLMIVDLERNDLGRVAQPKTVIVDELFKLESYATVHHLVANITAKIDSKYNLIDCIKATFPGGSITGAPKIRAMEIIDELEPTQRKVYTGSVGYIGLNNSLELNIAIRTIILSKQTAYLQVGGGIVWDSDPESEYQESLTKAHALKKALEL